MSNIIKLDNFNTIWETGFWPEEWRETFIPFLKMGSLGDCNNCRQLL